MKDFLIVIDDEALQDIQNATDWYNLQLLGLGTRFQKQVIKQINSLKKDANLYAIRYQNIRCMLVKKFPFMIHFLLDDKFEKVEIFAIIHTSKNPKIWFKRLQNI